MVTGFNAVVVVVALRYLRGEGLCGVGLTIGVGIWLAFGLN